jgi:hypothetical protein
VVASMTANSVPVSGTSAIKVSAAVSSVPGPYPVTAYATSDGLTRTGTAYLVVPPTSVRLSTVGLTFAAQKVRTSSPVQAFTIKNFGKKSLSLPGFVFPGAKDYTQTNNWGSALAAGATCSGSVTFTPKAVGPPNGSLTIADSDALSPPRSLVSLVRESSSIFSFPRWRRARRG